VVVKKMYELSERTARTRSNNQQITLGGIVVRRFLLAYRISRASEASTRLPFKF
jgi:hypothetical protein